MIIRTQKRPGVTLIEVLVATGILAIGIISIMALFPIGAVSMVRAINQNRASDHAANSDAMLRFYWKRAWLDTNGGGVRPLDQAILASNEPMIAYLDRHPTDLPLPAPSRIPATSSQPSFPVMVDPIGVRTQSGASNNAVGGFPGVLPTRVGLAAANDIRSTIRVSTLLDDLTFDKNGEPSAASGQLERGGRYNVAWMIQRPKNNIPHEVHVRVLIYGGRSPTDTPSSEVAIISYVDGYSDTIDPKPNTIRVPYGVQSKPAVKKGSWIGFAVALQPLGGTVIPGFDFYRVAAITDDSSMQMTIELEQPVRNYSSSQFVAGTYAAGTGTITGVLVVFDNLIEVFDRGIMSATGISGR